MKSILLKHDKNYLLQAKGIYSPKDLVQTTQCHLNLSPSSAAEPESVDLSEYYLLPAFCDCHTHIALSGWDFETHLELWHDRERLLEIYRANLARCFRAGVLTIREGGDPNDCLLNLTPEVPVTILSPGYGMSKTGFYGGFITHQSSEVADMLPQLHALKAAGASHCKIFLSGLVNFQTYGKVGKIQFSQEELELLTATAHELGMPVMVHANAPTAIDMCIKAGVNSIEHGYYMTQAQILKLAAKNIAWVPTVVPVAKQIDTYPITARIVAEQLANIRFAVNNGVQVGVGTDAGAGGVYFGISYHEELELYKAAGLSHQQMLMAACVVSPAICGATIPKFLIYANDPGLTTTDLKEFIGFIQPE